MMSNQQPTSTAQKVFEYRRSAELLLRDIDDAIQDLAFQEREGTIVHAVDFTEVHAFVLPAEEVGSIGLLPGLTTAQQIALNLAVLNVVFFGHCGVQTTPPVVLLAPYRVELRRSEGAFQQRAFSNFRVIVENAINQLKQLRVDEDLRTILADLDRAEEDPTRAEQSRIRLVQRLNESASELLLLTLDPKSWSPHTRLRDLLERAHLVDLSAPEIVGRQVFPEELDRKFVDEIYSLIKDRRMSRVEGQTKLGPEKKFRMQNNAEATSRIDALAAAYIIRANDIIAADPRIGPRRRLVLVTRSETMLTAIAEYCKATGHERLTQFFRRPRAFSAALLQPGINGKDRLNNLRQRRISLELLLRGLRPRSESGTSAVEAAFAERGEGPLPEIGELRDLWRSAVNLMVASADWNVVRGRGDALDSDINEVLGLLRDRHHVNEFIARAATRLAADINLTNALIGRFQPYGSAQSAADAEIESMGGRRRSTAPVFIWSKRTFRTIGIYFYHPLVREARAEGKSGDRALERLLTVGRSGRSATWRRERDIVDEISFDEKDRSSVLVESCLASSFFEAVADRWDLAELYADMAVNWSTVLDPTPRHEALYMRAVCRRRAADPTEARLRQGLEDLDKAIEERRRVERNPELADARYVFERGVHLFSWWEHFEREKARGNLAVETIGVGDEQSESHDQNAGVEQTKNLSEAIRLFDLSKNLLEKKIEEYLQRTDNTTTKVPASLSRQLLDIANARCYIAATVGKPDDSAFKLYVELVDAIRYCGWDEETVPLGILDTLCWAMFKLHARLPDLKRLEGTARRLSDRLPLDRRPAADRSIVEEHLFKIEKKLKLGLPLRRSAGEAA